MDDPLANKSMVDPLIKMCLHIVEDPPYNIHHATEDPLISKAPHMEPTTINVLFHVMEDPPTRKYPCFYPPASMEYPKGNKSHKGRVAPLNYVTPHISL